MALNKVEEPTLDKVIQSFIDKSLYQTHTCLPGIIESIDMATKKADIRVAIKTRNINEQNAKELPLLVDVPVTFYQTSNTIISVPVKKGDDCLVLFNERSLDIWKTNTVTNIDQRIVDPKDPRKHNLSDAFCIPIAKPIGTGLTGDTDKIKVAYTEQNQLTIDESGHLKYINADGSICEVINNIFKFTNADGSIFEIDGNTLKFTSSDGAILKVEGTVMNFSNPGGANFDINTAGQFGISNSSGNALSAISTYMGQAISAFGTLNGLLTPPGIIPNITAMTAAQSELNGVKQ
jgi:hypothetical protein